MADLRLDRDAPRGPIERAADLAADAAGVALRQRGLELERVLVIVRAENTSPDTGLCFEFGTEHDDEDAYYRALRDTLERALERLP